MDTKTAKRKYIAHRSRAKYRGIGFELTFEQWLSVWGDKIDLIGVHPDEYGMCRVMDSGPYAVGNVFIGRPARNAYTRRIVNHDRRMRELKEYQVEHYRNSPPRDEEPEDPWLPTHLKGIRRSFSF